MTRLLSGLLALVCAVTLWATPADSQTYTRPGQLSQSWGCTLTGLVATLTKCQAGTPVAGVVSLRLYITDIIVQTTTATAGGYSIQYGTGTNCATGTTALFPSDNVSSTFKAPVVANPAADLHFTTPLIPAAGADICVIGTGTNTINIYLTGFLAP